MKKLFMVWSVAFAMLIGAAPASAALSFSLFGLFDGFTTDPSYGGSESDPATTTDLLFVFGLSDGSAPTETTIDGMEVLKYSLASLVVQNISMGYETPLTGNLFFFTAPSLFTIGFGQGEASIISATLSVGCSCGPEPVGYNGEEFFEADFEGTSIGVPIGEFDTLSGFADGAFLALDTDLLGAVPEPATWAIFLLGFGVTGVAMRRRRAATALAA